MISVKTFIKDINDITERVADNRIENFALRRCVKSQIHSEWEKSIRATAQGGCYTT
jgi:hypothetical protein